MTPPKRSSHRPMQNTGLVLCAVTAYDLGMAAWNLSTGAPGWALVQLAIAALTALAAVIVLRKAAHYRVLDEVAATVADQIVTTWRAGIWLHLYSWPTAELRALRAQLAQRHLLSSADDLAPESAKLRRFVDQLNGVAGRPVRIAGIIRCSEDSIFTEEAAAGLVGQVTQVHVTGRQSASGRVLSAVLIDSQAISLLVEVQEWHLDDGR